MTEHSREAIAAYPWDPAIGPNAVVTYNLRTAYDRGRAEAEADLLSAFTAGRAMARTERLNTTHKALENVAIETPFIHSGDGLTGALPGEASILANAILASGIITEPGKPALDRDALRATVEQALRDRIMHTNMSGDERRARADHVTDAILAVVRDERDVLTEYEARRKADPIKIENIEGEPAEYWMNRFQAEALEGLSAELRAHVSGYGGKHDSPQLAAGRDIVRMIDARAAEYRKGADHG